MGLMCTGIIEQLERRVILNAQASKLGECKKASQMVSQREDPRLLKKNMACHCRVSLVASTSIEDRIWRGMNRISTNRGSGLG